MENSAMGTTKRIVASHGRGRMEKAVQNRMEGEAFMEENRRKEGVVTLPSGLQYRNVSDGDGASPGPTDWVTVHYRGTLLNGTEFDSSYSRGKPETFQVNGVIKGWSEALQLMSEGSGSAIGPDSTLIFEVELLSVEK
jgi:FKBP-type peptidyl-prolyl cis-trans isomerase FklB